MFKSDHLVSHFWASEVPDETEVPLESPKDSSRSRLSWGSPLSQCSCLDLEPSTLKLVSDKSDLDPWTYPIKMGKLTHHDFFWGYQYNPPLFFLGGGFGGVRQKHVKSWNRAGKGVLSGSGAFKSSTRTLARPASGTKAGGLGSPNMLAQGSLAGYPRNSRG